MSERVESLFELAIAHAYFLSIYQNELDTAWSGLLSAALAHCILSRAHELPPSTLSSSLSLTSHVVRTDPPLNATFSSLTGQQVQIAFAGAMKVASPILHEMAALNVSREKLAELQMAGYKWEGALVTRASGSTASNFLLYKGYCDNAALDCLATHETVSTPTAIPQPRLTSIWQPQPPGHLLIIPQVPVVPHHLPPPPPSNHARCVPQLVTTLNPHAVDLRQPLVPIQIQIRVIPPLKPPPQYQSPASPSPKPERNAAPKGKAKAKAKANDVTIPAPQLKPKPKPKAKGKRKSDQDGENIDSHPNPRPRRRRKSNPEDEEMADPTFAAPKKAPVRRRRSMPAASVASGTLAPDAAASNAVAGSSPLSGRLSLGF